MDSKVLGLRLKEARLSKKMTQSEVVGTFITRNMLSQIESGNAVPSMKTLSYLAEVLELSPAALLQDETLPDTASATPEEALSELTQNTDTMHYLAARQLVQTGAWAEAIERLLPLCESSSFTGEAQKLCSTCAIKLAEQKESAGELAEALTYAKLAEQYATGMFASASDKTEALLLLSRIAAAMAVSK